MSRAFFFDDDDVEGNKLMSEIFGSQIGAIFVSLINLFKCEGGGVA